ncbi:hypothetical protein A3768_0895 [Ralstonia solanacearum]|nr:hypothetical protein A3768_0895 [Ralstonia solanacearum]
MPLLHVLSAIDADIGSGHIGGILGAQVQDAILAFAYEEMLHRDKHRRPSKPPRETLIYQARRSSLT